MQASDPLGTHLPGQEQPAGLQSGLPGAPRERRDHSSLEILLEIHQAILSSQDLQTTAHLVLSHIQDLTPEYRAGSVILLELPSAQAQVLAFNFEGQETSWPPGGQLGLADLAVDLEDLTRGNLYVIDDLLLLDDLLPLQATMISHGIRSYMTAPLRFRGELIGLLNLASGLPGCFDEEHKRILREIGDSLAVAVQQARLLGAEQQRRREAEMMWDVMAALAGSVNLNQVLEVILRNLGKVVRYDRAALYLQNENAQFQLPVSFASAEDQLPKMFPVDDPIIAELQASRHPLVVVDIQDDARFSAWPERKHVRSWMGLPLVSNDELIGIVSLGDLRPGIYSSADASLAQVFLNQVADVLHRAQEQDVSIRRAEELELLTSFSFALRQAENQDNVFAALMEQATQVFGASQGAFLFLERDESALVVSFSQQAELVGLWHPRGADPLWQAVLTSRPVFLSDAQAMLRQYAFPIYRALFGDSQSAALLPLGTPTEGVFGLLSFTFQDRQEFSKEDQRSYQAISEIAGTALRRAVVLEGLEKQVNTRTRHLSTLYEIIAVASEPEVFETLLERMLSITLDVLESPVGVIHLVDTQQNKLSMAANVGLPQEISSEIEVLPLTRPFWRSLIQSSEPLVIPDLLIDPRAPAELRSSPYPSFMAAPIRSKGQSLGLLSLLGESILNFTIEDITLFTTIADNIGSVVERARLQRQAENAAVAEERQRLARELHDSISQLLYSLVLYAGAGRKVLRHGALPLVEEYLQRIDQTSQQALKEMRLMVYELRPSVFREEGLVGAVNRRLQAVEKRTGMNAQLVVEGEISLDEATELALYRIIEEALNNTLKHAEASEVMVRMSKKSGYVDLEIRDNGKGFITNEVQTAGGLGLTGIQERVSHLNGRLEIISTPGQGTAIHVRLEAFDG